MLKSETHFQVPVIFPKSIVIRLAVAQKRERLRQFLRGQRLALENPQIPVRPHLATAIVMHIILRQLDNSVRVRGKRTQILLVHRSLRRIHRANLQMGESRLLLGEGNRPQKIAELLQHVLLAKFLQPNAQISLIRHAAIIPEWEKADGKSGSAQIEITNASRTKAPRPISPA